MRDLWFDQEGGTFIEEESGRLSAMAAEETGYRLAATGGHMVNDIYGQVPELGWTRLVQEFLMN